ncbi:uncharacterized protein Q1 colocalized with Q [Cutibacterium acnes JCM 18920]|nr:uncharacterized protein Q1 colocalized with Q [Cutibacterium acnes JCM 18920]
MYPVVFDELRSRILGYSWSDKLEVHEIPAPTRISPFSVALEGSVAIRGDELGSGVSSCCTILPVLKPGKAPAVSSP